MQELTTAEQLWHYEQGVDGGLDALWLPFDVDSLDSNPRFIPRRESFEERRAAFLELLTLFLQKGYVRLVRQWEPGSPEVTGSLQDQIELLREAFPTNDEGMGDDVSWFVTTCPLDIVWAWPERRPEPIFPGHNPRYLDYIDEPAWAWDGTIRPEWANWKFTAGPRLLDDFDSVRSAEIFWQTHPDHFVITPRPERILD